MKLSQILFVNFQNRSIFLACIAIPAWFSKVVKSKILFLFKYVQIYNPSDIIKLRIGVQTAFLVNTFKNEKDSVSIKPDRRRFLLFSQHFSVFFFYHVWFLGTELSLWYFRLTKCLFLFYLESNFKRKSFMSRIYLAKE